MYTCLAIFGGSSQDRNNTLGKALRILEIQTPSLRKRLTWTVRTDVGPMGSWLYSGPEEGLRVPLISQCITDQGAVLVYGELYGEHRLTDAASHVIQVWQRDGVDAVRLMDGSFGAILVSQGGEVTIVSDTMGRRTFRYFASGDRLFVSTHDIPLVATGCCPLDIDPVSLASVLITDSSIGGHCLLRGLSSSDPMLVVRWKNQVVTRKVASIMPEGEPLVHGDMRGCRQLTDEMIEGLRQRVASIAANKDAMNVQLTAGIDSRAGLSMLLSLYPVERLKAVTVGTEDHLDVRYAKRVAACLGVTHEIRPVVMPSTEDFFENLDMLTFYRNGDLSAAYAIAPVFQFDPRAILLWGHGGGELFRPYFYNRTVSRTHGCSLDRARAVLHGKLGGVNKLPWRDASVPAEFMKRHDQVFNRLASVADDGSLVIDLYYLYERFVRWMLGAREPHEYHRYHTLESPIVTRSNLRLPRPVGHHNRLHVELIRRYCPQVYWLPVNGWELLPLQRIPALARLNNVYRLGRGATLRAMAKMSRTGGHTLHGERSKVLAGSAFFAAIRERLLSARSLGVEMFGRPFVESVIDRLRAAHRETYAFHVLCYLITFEHWREQIDRIALLARKDA